MANYGSKTKEGKCIFCEIARGNIEPRKGGKFWENEKYMAWLSPFPNTNGFTVVIPKKHYGSDVLQMPDKELAEFIIEIKKISEHLLSKLENVGRIGLIMEGTGIDHAHIKLIPLHGTEYMKKGEWRQVHSRVNTYFKTYLGYISSNDGPKANEKSIEKLCKKNPLLKEILEKKMKEILQNPQHYKPLKYDFAGERRVHIMKNFVLKFGIHESIQAVEFIFFGHHDEAYRR